MSWLLPVASTFAIFPQSPAILEVQRVTGRKQKSLDIFSVLGGEVTVHSFSQKGVNSSWPLPLSVVLKGSRDRNWSVWMCKSTK